MNGQRKPWGFSLIELLVAIAIVAILALAAAPLGRAWVVNSQIDNSANNLKTAYAFARALALENTSNQVGSAPASYLQVSGGFIQVYVQAGVPLWQRPLDAAITIEFQVENSCTNNRLELTNMGIPVDADCLSYTITGEGINEAYVFNLQ